MIRRLQYLGALFWGLTAGMGCAPSESGPQTYIDRFYRNEEQFLRLVDLLQAEPLTQKPRNRTLFWKEFSNRTKKHLQQLGITGVRVHSFTTNGVHPGLKTNWKASLPIYLYFHTLDATAAGTPPERRALNCREAWPLNEHWTLCFENPARAKP